MNECFIFIKESWKQMQHGFHKNIKQLNLKTGVMVLCITLIN